MIRITQTHEGSKSRLFVEGTLAGDWVDVLEESWLEAQTSGGEPMCIDLSGVTYIDNKGRELLARGRGLRPRQMVGRRRPALPAMVELDGW